MTMTRKANIQRLLSPESVAFIGGRDMAGAIRNCEALGYDGEIRVVHPRYEEIAGYPCYTCVADLPEAPDAAFVGVRRELAVEVVRELAARDVGGCVCYAAGFAELGEEGRALQQELVAAAGEMALVGPNCYGLLNYLNGAALWPDLHGGERVVRGVAIVSQSGNVSLNLTMSDRSLPVSHVISIGNQAVLGFGDYVDALVEDPRVAAVGMYIEGIDDVEGFDRAATRALKKGIPLVALKSGSSELGTQITLSHTSSLSGPDDLYGALFERLGIVRARSLSEFVETLKLLSVPKPLEGGRLGVLAGSGGDSALFADLACGTDLEIVGFEEAQSAALREQLGSFASVSNPLDYNTAVWGDREELRRCFTTVMEGDFDAAVLTLDFPCPGCGERDPWYAAAEALVASSKSTGVPAVVASSIPELLPEDARESLLAGGVVPLQGLPEAVAAIEGAAWYAKRRREILADGPKKLAPTRPGVGPESLLPLDESESKRRLADFGLRVPEGKITNANDAPEAAVVIGFPVAIKLLDHTIAHKSEAGVVALDLSSVEQVRRAVEKVGVNGDGRRFLVESMVTDVVAELIVGVKRDDRFGLALVIGSGGTLVELVGDSATLLLPTVRRDVERALDSLKASHLIAGFRGGPEGDREAVVESVLSIAAFAGRHRDRIEELEINPLLVHTRGRGAVAADALIRMLPE
jgi:acyl-CoA synthetase (NDP forming)